ncbi:HlyD family efflux transporter periplasmic adaptor subunit [Chitinivorax sp. B]|uniref:HlyD family efflux transporter periplasmic adaptor subunit n=1 Tax=Chitinivorax sp. B TaxID=2502235 RepID=UPI0014852E7D|nr:HlyD family efflux transporter periplasmic adaptor subunit [Chitinivorax sp. B]
MVGLVTVPTLRLPAMRQELSLHPGPAGEGGAPSWVLHDPAANRFYEIGWPAFEILSRWPLGEAVAIVDDIHQTTTLKLDEDDIAAVVDFLFRHNLLQSGAPAYTDNLLAQARANRLGPAKWLLKNYLFFRIPLVRPMPLLRRLLPAFELVCHPRFWWGVVAALIVGLFMVSRRWDEFTHTFAAYSGFSALIGIGLSLSFAKILHEFGHAMTACRFGCRIPTMGVAFLVMFPVLYTDTNEAWKLPSRRQRMLIGAAGMLAELTLAVGATLAWNFLPDGPMRAAVFLLATTTWVVTLAVNASPFMRFDGYFLLSDWWGIPNLHSRSFELGRWWLRKQLFGWQDDPPEPWPPARQRSLILFAYATWLYRLVLFVGIALLVYHVFFKALGIVLLLVELGWFIAYPLWRELMVWWQRRADMHWNHATRRGALMLAVILAILVVPWHGRVSAPAMLGAAAATTLYTPVDAEVQMVWVHDGQVVEAGQELLRLTSPDLLWQRRRAQSQADALRWRIEQQPFDDKLLAEGQALTKQWQVALERVTALDQQLARLTFRAPFAGRVVDTSQALQPGTLIPAGERMLSLVNPTQVKGEAFVDELQRQRLQPDTLAIFIADRGGQGAIRCRVNNVDRLALPNLDQLYLASTFGGPIPTQRLRDTLQPLTSLFRVRLDQCQTSQPLLQEIPGMATLVSDRQSLLAGWLRQGMAVLQREGGL